MRWLRATVVALLLPAIAQGQATAATLPLPTDSTMIARGAVLEVSLLTIGWGPEIWSRFGHNAIRVRDRMTGFDMSYNWGMFDFNQPNFLGRFLTGDTKYWMEGIPTQFMVEAYGRQARSVREQRLLLTDGERGALLAFLEWNALEANKYYRYDYYRDNCSTRARDALDRVLGGSLRPSLEAVRTASSWRSSTERLTASSPLAFAGISLALGRNADRPLTAWDEAFLPVRFARAIDSLVLAVPGGGTRRLVESSRDLVPETRPAEPESAPTWAWWKSAAVAVVVWGLCWLVTRGAGLSATINVLWYAMTGIVGTLLLLAGTVTKHAPYMGSNASLGLVNPLHLALAVLVPIAVLRWRRGDDSRFVRTTRILAIASAAVALLSPLVFAAIGQHVLPVGALAPLHLIGPVALGVGWPSRPTPSA
jgi:hypothetical protein